MEGPSLTTVHDEREALAREGLPVRHRELWGARHDYRLSRAVSEPARVFFLHLAVIRDPLDATAAEDQRMRTVEAIGQQRFGGSRESAGISYNAAVFNTARWVYEGQPLGRRGAHTVNNRNIKVCDTRGCPGRGRSIPRGVDDDGVNLNTVGRALVLPQMESDDVTDGQVDLAARWAATLIRRGLAFHDTRWHGHRCVDAEKSCPGDKAFARLPEIQQLSDLYVREGLADMIRDEDVDRIADAVIAKLRFAPMSRPPSYGNPAATYTDVTLQDLQKWTFENARKALLEDRAERTPDPPD